MSSLLIRNIPKKTIGLAKMIASKNHRSLQEEVSQMIIQTVRLHAGLWSNNAEDIIKSVKRTGKKHSDSTALLRIDRSR